MSGMGGNGPRAHCWCFCLCLHSCVHPLYPTQHHSLHHCTKWRDESWAAAALLGRAARHPRQMGHFEHQTAEARTLEDKRKNITTKSKCQHHALSI